MAKTTNGETVEKHIAQGDDGPETLSDIIQAWGQENIRNMFDPAYNGIPPENVLSEVGKALHAVQEFLVDPVAHNLKQFADSFSDTWSGVLPEEERPVSYADIGRLIAWTDDLRMECGYLYDPIANITVLVHEDLLTIAAGYHPDGILDQPDWKAKVSGLHGLDGPGW